MSAYTETGGGFPARFDSRNYEVTDMRFGFNGNMALAGNMQLMLNGEWAHRVENNGVTTSGQFLGLSSFSLNNPSTETSWFKGGIGLGGKLGAGKGYVMVNGSTDGPMPSVWLSASYQVKF